MNAKCGGCGGTHETIAQYRECQGAASEAESAAEVLDGITGEQTIMNPPSDKQVAYILDLLKTHIWPDDFSEGDLKSMERRQVSTLIESLKKAPRRDKSNGATSPNQGFDDIPDGRYAIQWRSIKNAGWKFYQVKHGHTRVFVDLLIGSPGEYRKTSLRGADVNTVLHEIRDITPRQASINFGLESETCGVCSSPLTNAESIALGIGPVCRNKMGW